MIEWIGIICCSSLISCVCSLLTTSICLSVTGGHLRTKSKKPVKEKSQDGLPVSEISKTYQVEGISRRQSQSHVVPPQISSRKQSYTHSNKIQSTESQQKNAEHSKQLEKSSEKSFCDNSTCKNLTVPVSVCCKIPTEGEIQKTIDEFNTLFRQYNEIISNSPGQDVQKTQSSVKFQTPNSNQKSINVGVMTEQENREIISYKSNSKIRKCKCTNSKKEIRRHSSSQIVKTAKSCSCSVRKSKSDLGMRKTPSSKSIDKSNYFVKSPGYSKQHVNSKSSWISKTMKKLRSKDARK